MKKTILLTFVWVGMLFGLSSCNKNDGYSLDKFWISYGTLKGDLTYYDILLDNGTTLFISNFAPLPPASGPVEGRRVIVNYTILSDTSDMNGDPAHTVKLNAMYDVLCKLPKYSSQLDEEEQTEIGYDPIEVEDIWFGGKYLNINYTILRQDIGLKHYLNLVVDSDRTTDTDIYVELRHNAYGDPTSIAAFGRVSFDIEDFLKNPDRESVNVHLSYKNYREETVTFDGVYRKNSKFYPEETPSGALEASQADAR